MEIFNRSKEFIEKLNIVNIGKPEEGHLGGNVALGKGSNVNDNKHGIENWEATPKKWKEHDFKGFKDRAQSRDDELEALGKYKGNPF